MSEYRVALRHTTLLESAALEAKGDDRYFIATAAPPPTHSILTLHGSEDGEDGPKLFLVDKVFEVEGNEQPRGVVGKLTDAQAHEAASMMGTEHLEDGQAPPEDHAPAMAMPAPVVDPDLDDGEPDLQERERLEPNSDSDSNSDADPGSGSDSAEQQRADGEAPAEAAEAPTTDAENPGNAASGDERSSGGSKRSRRRNRKRR
ncbi:MAG: hypothetical protein ACRBN8_05725 [Nannocystales bacterium]